MHPPLVFDSRWDALVRWFCVKIAHRGASTRRRLRGEITCGRCYTVLGHWR